MAIVLLAFPAAAQEAPPADPTTSVETTVAPPVDPTAETTTTTATVAAPRPFLDFQAWEVGDRVTVAGSVTDMTGLCPPAGCAFIKLQRLYGPSYVTLTGTRLKADGTFVLGARRFGPGPWRLLVEAANRDAIFQDAQFVPPPTTTTTTTAAPSTPPASGDDTPRPPSGGVAPPAGSGTGRRIVYSRRMMRVWLVEDDGSVRLTAAVSGRFEKPGPGTYRVFSKSRYTYAVQNPSIRWEYMVRFASARNGSIGFHQIPLQNGRPVQSEAQLGVGGLSGGCVRMSRRDILVVWDWAGIGTKVVVLP